MVRWLLGIRFKSLGYCAGIIIVEEAGGLATKVNGEKITLNDKEILSSNGLIHEKIRENLIN